MTSKPWKVPADLSELIERLRRLPVKVYGYKDVGGRPCGYFAKAVRLADVALIVKRLEELAGKYEAGE